MINLIFLTAFSFLDPAIPADSLRLEVINGKSFVIHQVGERETLYGISRRYGATIPGILEFNPTADGGLEIGTILKVPYTPKSKVQSPAGLIHTVAPKETLFSISKLYNVTIDELRTWNSLSDYALSTGQTLVIKKRNTTLATSPESKPTEVKTIPSGGMRHVVVQGETLFSIARQYNVTVQQIKDWNSLATNELKIGQAISLSSSMTTPASTTVSTPVPVVATTPRPQETTPGVVPKPAVTMPVENTIKISESVAGTDEIKEAGIAELIEGTEGNRKYMALHRSAPTGTILKVRNELNNREVFVRVVGSLPATSVNDKIIIKISKSAYDRLGAIDPKFRAEVTYYPVKI
jgi:LysM repeat protein